MAPITTHLVIGERLFPYMVDMFGSLDYGGFLCGSVLVDLHAFSSVKRRTTHFADTHDKESPFAFARSCQNFIDQRENLLKRPWNELSDDEIAFVLGYFCHLSADENWKQFDWDVYKVRGIDLWSDLPISSNILLTVFDVESANHYIDFPGVSKALHTSVIPNVFSHVPYEEFERVWEIIKVHVEQKGSLETYLEIQKRLGKPESDCDNMRKEYARNWSVAEELIDKHFGGIEMRVNSMIQQSLETVTRFRNIFAFYPASSSR